MLACGAPSSANDAGVSGGGGGGTAAAEVTESAPDPRGNGGLGGLGGVDAGCTTTVETTAVAAATAVVGRPAVVDVAAPGAENRGGPKAPGERSNGVAGNAMDGAAA